VGGLPASQILLLKALEASAVAACFYDGSKDSTPAARRSSPNTCRQRGFWPIMRNQLFFSFDKTTTAAPSLMSKVGRSSAMAAIPAFPAASYSSCVAFWVFANTAQLDCCSRPACRMGCSVGHSLGLVARAF